jgi:hypothetical protein
MDAYFSKPLPTASAPANKGKDNKMSKAGKF